jgi:hypothetical protein
LAGTDCGTIERICQPLSSAEILTTTYKAKEGRKLRRDSLLAKLSRDFDMGTLTVFFLARSPDAPRTTITVLSFSSMVLAG